MVGCDMGLLVRTWVGHKPFHYLDHETGERRVCHKGDEVKVSATTVKAFGSFFVDANVAKAQKAAKDAESAAEAQVKSTASAKGGKGGGSGGGSGGNATSSR